MGQQHSTPKPHCDYSNYKNTIKQLKSELKAEQNKNTGGVKEIQKLKYQILLENSKIDRLSTLFFIDKSHRKFSKKDFNVIGKKQYKLLYNNYKEQLHIADLQQQLLDKQLRLAGVKDMKISKQETEINKISNIIVVPSNRFKPTFNSDASSDLSPKPA